MVKSLPATKKSLTPRNSLNSTKDGFIQKTKTHKFKNTPTGKITLINGSKTDNNNMKAKNISVLKSPKESKEAQKKNDKKQEASKKDLSRKSSSDSEEDDSDSEVDINEGVELGDQSIMEETEDTDSEESEEDEEESEEEKPVPNILGTSLADETDEDDEEYMGKEEGKVKKGVKMFGGLSAKNKSMNSTVDTSDKSAVDGSSEDSDEDEEEEDEEDVEDEEESEDDDSEEDEESEDEEETNESGLGLKALLGNSIAEDDDDEDFVQPEENDEDDDSSEEEEEEEEEDENNTSTNSKSNKNSKDDANTSLDELKQDKMTIFVGNLPTEVTRKQITKLFKKFGQIDTIRLRGIISKSNLPKKGDKPNAKAALVKSVYAYVKFNSEDSVQPALSLNGTQFEGNYLRVDIAGKEGKHDPKKSVFIGNLKFIIDENTVRKHFEQCGEIESVRVVRDGKTGVGKGFGYVNFKSEDSVALALELDGTTLSNREIRVKPSVDQHKSKKEKHAKRSRSGGSSDSLTPKKAKSDSDSEPVRNKKNAMKRLAQKEQKAEKNQASPQQSFQGQKATDAKKKRKNNKQDKKKKILAEKLTAKPKKRSN